VKPTPGSDPIGFVESARNAREGERWEFKEAKSKYGAREAVRYCAAIANHGGGYLILGMTDRPPRQVVGSKAFAGQSLNGVIREVATLRTIHVPVVEIDHPDGRVVVFEVPPHPRGEPVMHDGQALMREGDSLIGMSGPMLRRIVAESITDVSATICEAASVNDLNSEAVARLRSLRDETRPDKRTDGSDEKFLRDIGLVAPSGVTFGALILLGTEEAVGRYLPSAEVIYEYRAIESAIDYDKRAVYRAGYLAYQDELWNTIDARNGLVHEQRGPYRRPIRAFDERVVREALLNAVVHRNYSYAGSVVIRHSPTKLNVLSPGALPDEVTLDNILDRTVPRNRLLADVLEGCGLVQRSGQGMDLMFEASILAGKGHPTFHGTDAYQVVVQLPGEIVDPTFIQFLEATEADLSTDDRAKDLYILDLARSQEPIPPYLLDRAKELRKMGLLQTLGRGPGTRYVLPPRYYEMAKQRGVYTRVMGLDRRTNKELVHKHLLDSADSGSPIGELEQVLPDHSRSYIAGLLRELKKEGRAHADRPRRWARWFPGPDS
jgi:ATP-dependent DNA helicase RecG